MLSVRLVYVFSYNLLQFCGHTWIFTNTSARILTFGNDAMADTFYSAAIVMSSCQLFSVLELFHIADGLEDARLLPRFLQVAGRNAALAVVVATERVQNKPVVTFLFLLWNVGDLLRYPHELLCVLARPSTFMLRLRYTLWIVVYAASAAAEGVAVFQALRGQNPTFLVVYVPLLVLGVCVSVRELLKERKHNLDKRSNKKPKNNK